MEFRHLRYFLVLADELHFGRAARRLSISQPPLSLNIQQLEASVGARLFTRNSKEVRLTAAGKAFVPEARALLDHAADAARHARDVAQGLTGRLQVGFVGAMLFRGLPQMLGRFQASNPEVRVVLKELNSQDQLGELAHGRLDVGFVHTHRVADEMAQILVADEAFVCCLPAGHRLARKRSVALEALRDEPFVLFARSASPDYHERILGICADAGFTPDVRHEVRHWLSVVSLVAQGMGVALVPAALRRSGMDGAVFVRLDRSTANSQAYCVWKTPQDNAALAAFLAVVRAAAPAAASPAPPG
ncbi:LysR family transcriptional regulator [Rhodoferax koreense]|uniref:LysR family transcriptional regulator n=1 Tax=Rhodoferax koreensis TaxID=1842727 RepID=A0A1P8JXE1_9BURK|nr:LysR family transcriptional regulator [Rhodoferax koreense]APW38408.1 LysR family transcriptional regulator [Rhodoferax koreense]